MYFDQSPQYIQVRKLFAEIRHPPTKWPRKQKNVALEKFLEQPTSYCFNLYTVIQGVIFDSCPGKLSIKSFFNTMGFVLGGNVLRRKTIPFFYFVYFLWTKLLRIIIETDTNSDPMFWWDGYHDLQNPGNSTLGLFHCTIVWLETKCEIPYFFVMVFVLLPIQ